MGACEVGERQIELMPRMVTVPRIVFEPCLIALALTEVLQLVLALYELLLCRHLVACRLGCPCPCLAVIVLRLDAVALQLRKICRARGQLLLIFRNQFARVALGILRHLACRR